MMRRAACYFGILTVVCICLILWNLQWTLYMGNILTVPSIPRQDGNNMKDELIDSLIGVLDNHSVLHDTFWLSGYFETREAFRKNVTKAKYIFHETPSSQGKSNWDYFLRNVNDHYLYDWSDPRLDGLLKDMSTFNITSAEENAEGSKLKLIITFNHQFRVNARPMRYSRETVGNPNHFITEDVERHNAEIAAFHLDRLLGFCRVPPTTGRRLSLNTLKRFLQQKTLSTFFISPAGNTCFYGSCGQNCYRQFAVCGQGEILEFSLMAFLPTGVSKRKALGTINNPYKHTNAPPAKFEWETNNAFCEKLKKMNPYTNPHLLLDLIDTHVFDFLIGNRDRHTLYYFEEIGHSQILLLDNGQGFGLSDIDITAILAPLQQCCRIRKSTLLKLIKMYGGPDKLSVLMEKSLQLDPTSPVIVSAHLNALDRRVVKILRTVAGCIITKGLPVKTVVHEDI